MCEPRPFAPEKCSGYWIFSNTCKVAFNVNSKMN